MIDISICIRRIQWFNLLSIHVRFKMAFNAIESCIEFLFIFIYFCYQMTSKVNFISDHTDTHTHTHNIDFEGFTEWEIIGLELRMKNCRILQ